MAPDHKLKPSRIGKIVELAQELSSSVQLSFAEPVAGAFYNEAKAVISRTRRIYQELVKNLTERARGTPGIETLLDNAHKIASVLAEISDHWRRKETLRLPQVVDSEGKRRPRAYLIARSLVKEAGGAIDGESLTLFLKNYQREAPLSVRELDIFPDMLRFALIEEITLVMEAIRVSLFEMDEAERWLSRMVAVLGTRDADSRLAALANQLTQENRVVAVHFGFHLMQRIAQSGKERELRVVTRRLKLSLARQGVGAGRLPEMVARSEREQADVIDRAIASLHWLGQARWDRLSLPLNEVDRMLARDPADAFSDLTDETKSFYRRAIVRIADRTGVHDVEVAREALRLARAARPATIAGAVNRKTHVGYYLVGDGLSALEGVFHYESSLMERLRRAALAYPTAAYLGAIFGITLLLSWLAVSSVIQAALPSWAAISLSLAGLLLASEIAVVTAHIAFTHLLPPRPLPQLDCKKGVGESRRTIVVVPSMIRDSRSAKNLLSKLETNFVANDDPDIYFALLLDFGDAPEEHVPGDDARLSELVAGIARLNVSYPSALPRFSLFCRKRLWNPQEGVFMGWERKRGKLREFNGLLRGRQTSFVGDAAEVASKFGRVRYVLTIDEDTELARDSARALVGTIDHPLNRPLIDSVRRVVTDGYGIVMPRSAVRFSESQASAFSRIFGGFPGLEAYSTLVSDLHQDLFGDGLFQGKGIYDVDAVTVTMDGRIPENTVLSHDLLEGLYARVGTAANAHIFEGFPSTFRSYMARSHRWIRGDWQIIGWLGRRGSVLSGIAKWRIADNLRRSLLPVALVGALAGALFSPANAVFWSTIVLVALGAGQLLPTLARVFGMAVSRDKRFTFVYRFGTSAVELSVMCAKTVLLGVFALQSVFVSADAVTRSLWRLLVTKRKLLEWQTAYESAAGASHGFKSALRFWWPAYLAMLLVIYLNYYPAIAVDCLSLLWAGAWVAAPLISAIISRPARKNISLSARDSFFLRTVAARAYWFFVDLTTKESQWLPPDHYQEEPVSKRHAHGLGVSPTNLGMYLLSLSAARELGLATITQYSARIDGAFKSMALLERYRGHFFNWYELRALKPLAPQYVSSVDSANLALALLAVRNALREACTAPLYSRGMFEGFDAEMHVLAEWAARKMKACRKDSTESRLLREVLAAAAQSRTLIRKALADGVTPRESDLVSSGVVHHAVRIRNTLEALRLEEGSEEFEDVFLAAKHVEALAMENREFIGQYLSFAVVPAVSAMTADKDLRAVYARLADVLARIPSVESLASGETRRTIDGVGFAAAVDGSALPPPDKESARAWHVEVLSRLATAEEKAREIRGRLLSAADAARRYYDEMDFTFLYDEERGLFHMGYNSARGYFDDIFYDLFASEANSVSIVGIAKKQAPKEHWTYLSRKLVRSSDGAATPVSWAGSLFEYLGTMLYFDVPAGSFWGTTAQRAVAAHRRFARRLGIPWGMGESASSSMDASGNYHYQAFGEPSIGFKRNLSESVVVAPYTTALALPVAPRAAVKNLKRLTRSGAAGCYGFYDAFDFTAFCSGEEKAAAPARIFYAHHQGFILSSIANVILDGWVRRMIGAEPEMKSATQLFEEMMPQTPPVEPLPSAARFKLAVGRADQELAEAPRRYVSVRPREPRWNYLSNGSYRIKISCGGAGESKFEGIHIMRPNDGPLTESRGVFHYLCDRERGALWSPTHMPTRTIGERSSLSVGGQVMIFDKAYEGIVSSLAVAVDPDSPVEVRELTLTNQRPTPAVLSVGACAEIALTRRSEALTHQNFQNLFLASKTAFDDSGVLVWRSDERNVDHSAAAAFLVTTPEGRPEDLRLTRDRETFFGPLLDREAPLVMIDSGLAREDLPEHTLDTAVGYVTTLTLEPGETRSVALVISVGETREAALEAMRPYRKYRQVRKTIAGAGHAEAKALAELGIPSSQAETFDTLASLLNARRDNVSPGLSAECAPLVDCLWRRGISGERPIVLVSVFSLADLPLVRQMLTAHAYFVHKGVDADFVILNEHRGGYLKMLEDEIDFLLRVHGESSRSDAIKIYYVRGEELSAMEIRCLHSTATVRISAGEGSLADQMRAQQHVRPVILPPPLPPGDPEKREAYAVISRRWQPTRDSDLEFWNGFGGFDGASGAYVIVPPEGRFPPAPWSNIVANENIGFIATDRGTMFTWARNSRDNKLTVAYNDPLSSVTSEAFYVRDELTGDHYCPQPAIGGRQARYEIRHGEGYTEYRTHQGGLGIRLTAHVAPKAPVKYVSLTIKNDSGEGRQLSCFGYFELLLGSFAHETKKQLAFGLLDGNTLVVQNIYRNSFATSRAFLGIVGGADQFATSKEEFIGRFGSLTSPAALSRRGLSSRLDPAGEPAAVLSRKVVLEPGEEKNVVFYLGEGCSPEALSHLLTNDCNKDRVRASLTETVSYWRSLPKLTFELPDRGLSLLCNRFLTYQTVASRLFARAGFYQIGGAFGFRDQLQDVLSLLWHDPAFARAHILACAGRQFREGDVLSWWHPHNDFGARTLLSDQHLWLPYAVAHYVEFTGDTRILDEEAPYLEGEVPDAERRSVTGVFRAGKFRGTLYEHCLRAVDRGLTSGVHGLPLIGAADWNDSMNRVGSEGRGESVWLGWFTVIVLRGMADLCAARGDHDRAVRYRAEVENYLAALGRFAWDGNWYRRAYTDDGVPVGTRSGKSWRIDSVSQSWAVFALGLTPETRVALLSAKQEFRLWEGHAPLAWPPSDPELLDLGTLSDYPPGVRENAGQYNHAALWLAQAMFLAGDADAGKMLIDAVNPFKLTETSEKASIYCGEPYAVAADIYSAPTYPGRAGWTWYTASSGVFYRTVAEYLLGLKVRGNTLTFEPSFPSEWNEASARYSFKTSHYVIRYVVEHSDKAGEPVRVLLDGAAADRATIPLVDDGKTHEVTVYLVRPLKKS